MLVSIQHRFVCIRSSAHQDKQLMVVMLQFGAIKPQEKRRAWWEDIIDKVLVIPCKPWRRCDENMANNLLNAPHESDVFTCSYFSSLRWKFKWQNNMLHECQYLRTPVSVCIQARGCCFKTNLKNCEPLLKGLSQICLTNTCGVLNTCSPLN